MERECDCGCGQKIKVTGDSSKPTWNHPKEGGKVFATETCRGRYLHEHTRECAVRGCNTLILNGSGMCCDKHQNRTIALMRGGLGGKQAPAS